jgi:hypothetical protein
MSEGLRVLRAGVLLAMLAVFAGFALGAVFGAAEDALKGGLDADAKAVLDSKYGGDAAQAKAVVDKAWSYYKRAHLHWGGLGAAALSAVLLLAALGRPGRAAVLAGWALGLGSLGYPAYWLLAGSRAPGMGGTGAAKASLEWLAIPTSGAMIVGWVLALALVARALLRPAR